MAGLPMKEAFTAEDRKALKPRVVARSTFRYTDPHTGAETIRLHHTDIIKRFPDGSTWLDSGGWKTVTTRDRMSRFTRYSVYQNKGLWYVRDPDTGQEAPFFDGMCLPYAFSAPALKAQADEKKLREAVTAFVGKTIVNGKPLPEPWSGDCWFCLLRDDKGVPMGDVTENTEHIREHIREGYLPGALIFNALQWAGYRNPGLIFAMSQQSLRHTNVRSAVRRYLYAKLGLAR